MKYYSETTRGFYDSNVHKPEQIPNDALELSDNQYNSLLANNQAGKEIAVVNGNVIARHPVKTPAEQAAKAAASRRYNATQRFNTSIAKLILGEPMDEEDIQAATDYLS